MTSANDFFRAWKNNPMSIESRLEHGHKAVTHIGQYCGHQRLGDKKWCALLQFKLIDGTVIKTTKSSVKLIEKGEWLPLSDNWD